MVDDELFQVVFVSRCRGEIDEAQLHRIQQKASAHNQASGVTGVLLVGGGYFLQLLEGPHVALSAAVGRIAMDQRNENLTVLYCKPAKERRTGFWNMGVLDTRPLPWAVDILEMSRRLSEAQNAGDEAGFDSIDKFVHAFESMVAYNQAA